MVRNWHTASSSCGHERRHGRTRCVRQLLRDRRLGRGRPDRLAVRSHDAHCRKAADTRGRRQRRVATPTIVHFGAALLLSALLRAPWPTITPAAALWRLIGLGGAVYMVIVARRVRLQTVYRPGLEDWLFHALLPLGRTWHSRCRHPRLMRARVRCCLSLALLHCCCSSSAFITPGTPSPAMSLSTSPPRTVGKTTERSKR